jgi:hypothetical protein
MTNTVTLFAFALNLFALAACVWLIVSLSAREYPKGPAPTYRDPSRHRRRRSVR